MTELDVEISMGPVRIVSVSSLASAVPLIQGPARLHGWSLRQALATPGGIVTNPDGVTGNIAAATPGNVAIPATASLTGFDIDLSAVGTANMVVTVSNVPNGPYTYDLPAGQARLSVSYPVPLPPTGGAPTVAWAATAAAIGTIVAQGATFTGSTAAPAIAEFTSGGNRIAEAVLLTGASDTRWFGNDGIYVAQDITLQQVQGLIIGGVFISYYRE